MKTIITFCVFMTLLFTSGLAQKKLQAPEVTKVSIADDKGYFTQTDSKTWSAMIEGNPCVLIETSRDKWSIYLTATETKAPFVLNLWKKEILISGKTSYKVGSTSGDPIGESNTVITNVVTVTYKSGNSEGYLKNDSGTSWGEYGSNKAKRFSFEETSRDATSIDLFDQSRGYKITIDLTNNKVLLNGNPLYTIIRTSDKDDLGNSGEVTTSGNNDVTKTSGTGNNNNNSNNTSNTNKTYSTKVTIKNCGEHAIIVYRENEESGQREEIKRLAKTRSLTEEANLGDIFAFDVEGNANLEAEDFVVVDDHMHYCVRTNQVFANSGETTTRIGNASASRHGYDLKTIDPMYIHYNQNTSIKNVHGKKVGVGGQRAQIFDNLERQDVDWGEYDKNVALKLHFKGKAINTGRGNHVRKAYSSEEGFKKGFSANIGTSAGVSGEAGPVADAEVKAEASASFNHSTEENKSEKTVYTTNTIEQEWYEIELNHDYVDFTRAFLNDVIKLNSSKDDMGAYKTFITKYGSHYPLRTVYGAKMMSIEKYTYEDLSKATSWGIDVSAEASASGSFKGVGAERGGSIGVGYSESENYKNMEEKNTTMYQYIGGKGSSPDNWDVDAESVQPIDITLARISNLIDKKYFPYLPDVDFKGIQKMMANAITEYIGSPTDSGKSMKPSIYKISNIQFKNVEGLDDTQIYGNLNWVSADGTGDGKIWHVRDNAWGPDSPKYLHAGKKGKITEFPHRLDDKLIEDRASYAVWTVPSDQEKVIFLTGDLFRWHNMGRTDGENEEGDKLGSMSIVVPLSNINGSKEYKFSFENTFAWNWKSKCEVIFTIEKQTLSFMD